MAQEFNRGIADEIAAAVPTHAWACASIDAVRLS